MVGVRDEFCYITLTWPFTFNCHELDEVGETRIALVKLKIESSGG